MDNFVETFLSRTGGFSRRARAEILDARIEAAQLTVEQKAEAFRGVAPRRDFTSGREELRMERLLLSVDPADLSRFKFNLEYDEDYKDLVEYVYHDVDDEDLRASMLDHLARAPEAGVKVLTDVDDTMYANILDQRFPQQVFYPGLLAFYEALSNEPFRTDGVPITTLSARPNPIAGALEESSLQGLSEKSGGRLRPSGLSGALVSSGIGTAQTLIRSRLDAMDVLNDLVPDGQERRIGDVKFDNFVKFASVYPEYRFVFIGDSGQADAWTAHRMIELTGSLGSRVLTTFIHDLRLDPSETRSVSPSFLGLTSDELVNEASPTGRGVIVFRNTIDAALQAYHHRKSLGDLISIEALAAVTLAALTEFRQLDFSSVPTAQSTLWVQFREDGQAALAEIEAVGLAEAGPIGQALQWAPPR